MMRGVLFECPALRALRCVCHAFVALRCAALRGDDETAVERRARSLPSLLAHHHSTTKPYSQPVDVEGHAQGSNAPPSICSTHQLSSMQQGNKYVRHKPSLSFI